ncbi:MAG TPA: phage tail sheath C-terminal domain-containing protein [Sphingomicrobium sp.]|nr:phage tail sheath C-terminal domain-containing protein [Sphingomicrobium sp.]
MATAVSYPGVYVEEIPSGVRTITGVATSITAFLGRAAKGPVGETVFINSFGDFERQFGPLTADCPLAYAVRDFYLNGGSQAIIVRVFKADGAGGDKPAGIKMTNLELSAASPGGWGNMLRVRVDNKVSEDVANRYGLAKADLFNLTVRDTKTEATETFLNLTAKESPRRVDRVLNTESALVRVAEGFTLTDVPPPHGDAGAGKTIWDDDTASSKVANADKGKDSAGLDRGAYQGDTAKQTGGLQALLKTDLFNLLCIPGDVRGATLPKEVYQDAIDVCVKRRAMLIVDPPAEWKSANQIAKDSAKALTDLGLSGPAARNAAIFFPRLIESDPKLDGALDEFPPSGAVAGLFARTDATRGVWKAPAGVDAALAGVQALSVTLTDEENGQLNPLGVNCLRAFPIVGRISWGSRTMRGADLLADEYKYVPVRRLALYIEESLFRGLKWVVFEPNDEPLWAQIRLNVGAFMNGLFRQGAFQGMSPRDAYFVKCDRETTTQNDINLGIVNVVVGFAPLKPAEFVIIKLQQMAGQISI